MASHHYLLLNHASLTSFDPLGICEDGEDSVNHFVLLKALLTTASEALKQIALHASTAAQEHQRKAWCKVFVTLLQDISYSLHGDGNLKTAGLEEYLSDPETLDLQELERLREALFRHALRLNDPDLSFADGTLNQLSPDQPCTHFSLEETDALLAHMLLSTLSLPLGNTWGRPGFTELFARPSTTAHAHLHTLFHHFAEGGYSKPDPSSPTRLAFHLSTAPTLAPEDFSSSSAPTRPLPTTLVPTPSENSPAPAASFSSSHFSLIAAHSQPGPGPNGTQEERLVSQSPALALLSLVKPLLHPAEAVITSALPAHSAWTGHGRHATLTHLFDSRQRPRVRYIVADALELDGEDRRRSNTVLLPDLRPGNVEREVRKLYAAFSGAKRVHAQEDEVGGGGGGKSWMRIQLPPWGCGAFGGNLGVKVQCMMMAAALAGLDASELELVVTENRASELEDLPTRAESVREMFARLSAAFER